MSHNEFDVVVIGGGPAGASAAAILAEKGRKVAVLERTTFPRYHVGESLLPYCYFPLERLGLIERMKSSAFPKKYSVQFVSAEGKLSVPFYFFEHLKHEASMTWQVLRSDFDAMLLDNAVSKGATIFRETTAKDLIWEGGAVTGVKTDKGEFRAKMTVDATGRDAFAISRNGWKVRDPKLNKIAIWSYYKGALRDPGLDEGATTVAFVPHKGWFWYIPLPDDVVSVGVVAEKDYLYSDSKDLKTIYEREIRKNSWIEHHVSHGQSTGEYWVTGEYSYRSRHCAANGLVLTGDAFSFLDPVFSSGVFLALQGGVMVGDVVDEALRDGDVSAGRFEQYGAKLCLGIEQMRKLVYAFYDPRFSFKDFFMEYPQMKSDVTDCLIGHLFRDFSDLFRAMSEFASIPEPVSYGAPWMSSPAAPAPGGLAEPRP